MCHENVTTCLDPIHNVDDPCLCVFHCAFIVSSYYLRACYPKSAFKAKKCFTGIYNQHIKPVLDKMRKEIFLTQNNLLDSEMELFLSSIFDGIENCTALMQSPVSSK